MDRNAILVLMFCVIAGEAAAQRPLALRGLTVVDGTGAPPLLDAVVVIDGDRIASVGPRAKIIIPRNAQVEDLPGHYLVPGFIDMHAHVAFGPVFVAKRQGDPPLRFVYDDEASQAMLRRLLEYGVTTVRNPAGSTVEAVALRERVRRGAVPGPRIFTAGAVIDRITTPGLAVGVTTDSAMRAEVGAQARAGVDYIKLYASLSPALVAAGIDEAHRQGKKAIAHLFLTSWTDAAHAGIDGLVHIVPGSPALLPPERRGAFLRVIKGTQFMYQWFEYLDLIAPQIDTMLRALTARRIPVDPTLVTFEAMFRGNDTLITRSPDLTTAPPSLLTNWREEFQLSMGWSENDFAAAQAVWPKVFAFTKLLYDRGVFLVVGSDTPNPWVAPGTSFHREMELLVDAGIPPLEVLTLATRNGAEALGILEQVGTIEPGKRAELVLLDADPVADIRNTRRILRVFQGGSVVHTRPSHISVRDSIRALLDRLTEAVRRQDGRLMASVYGDSGAISFASHGVLIGSKAELASHYATWDSTQTRVRLFEWDEVRMDELSPSAVLVVGRLRIAIDGPGFPHDTLRMTWSGVFARRGGRWGLIHEHESFAAPREARPGDGLDRPARGGGRWGAHGRTGPIG